jgi:hypothetical protein
MNCTGCGEPTTDFIVIAGRLRLPYHQECADQASRDLAAIRDRVADALEARLRSRAGSMPGGPASRADEI